jgi:hypothetical protein
MPPLSTGGPVSSRTFTMRGMEKALMSLPSSQRSDVRKLARALDAKTSMGLYAALDFLANLGLFFSENAQDST